MTRPLRLLVDDSIADEAPHFQSHLLDAIDQAIIATDLDGTVRYWNRFAETLYGWPAAEALGRNITHLMLTPAYRDQAHGIMADLRTGKRWSGELTLQCRDGRTFPALVTDSPIVDEHGTLIGIVGVSIDITERKRAEQEAEVLAQVSAALSSSLEPSQLYHLILEQAAHLLPYDLASVILYEDGWATVGASMGKPALEVGTRFAPLDGSERFWQPPPDAVGYLPDTAEEPSWRDIPPHLGERRIRSHIAVPLVQDGVQVGGFSLGNTAPYYYSKRHLRLAGIFGERVAQALRNARLYAAERAARAQAEADIADRIRAEEALQRSEARLRAQFQELPVPTCTWQRQGEDWILIDYNRAADQISRGGIRGQIGTTAHAMYGHAPRVWDNFTRCWCEQSTITQELPYRMHTTGEVCDLIFSCVFVPPDMVLVHTIDVTERTRAQTAVNRHLGQLAALRAIDHAIAASLDLHLTLDVLLEQAVGQLGVDAAAVLLFNRQLQVLEFGAGRGLRTPALDLRRVALRLGEGLAGHAARECRLIHVPDLTRPDPRLAGSSDFSREGFVTYFGVPLVAKGEVHGVLELFHRTAREVDEAWLAFLEMLAGQAAIAIDNARLYEGLQRSNMDLALAYDSTLEGWSCALDLRDRETEGHSQRVADLTLRLARILGMGEAELVQVRRGALLHDIGKMGIPDSILLKPGPLTEEEWEVMRRHPTYAYELLSPIAYLRPALDIPYCHHEKWDGTGYPRGLKGERIPLAARIFAVVDVWDALRSDRPYRAGWPEDKAREQIRSQAGRHFDPRVVAAFLQLI